MLFCSRPLLAWMAKKWPIHEGEAEVLGELDRYLATGQLPTDARRLDVGAAEYAHGILQRLALEEERALERRAEQEERAREAMVRRVRKTRRSRRGPGRRGTGGVAWLWPTSR
jgi:hypothetical protein